MSSLATPQSGVAIGIDVGGTKIAAALVDLESGRVSHRTLLPTSATRPASLILADIRAITRRLLEDAELYGQPPVGVGLCVAELVDPAGVITSATTLPFMGLCLTDELDTAGTVTVDADVRAGASAEAWFGAGRGLRSFVYVTVGTGISSTLVVGGEPYAGSHGNALLLGSGVVSTTCRHCGRTMDWSFEELASGPAIARRFAEARGSEDTHRAEAVFEAAERGDQVAGRILDEAGRALGDALAWVTNLYDPDAVVLGGGVGLAGGRFLSTATERCRQHVWAPSSRAIRIEPAALGPDAPIVGAAVRAASAARSKRKSNRTAAAG
jgi:glucokinase